ncbi:centrosomal protein of 152 kDa isoform X2 [Octopus bimaculoides]|uniref:Centrosomal protein of 152 kDa n=2 Tax=Octopus bimaculoides TaxID=37653 RepID=A0A0L8I0W1_OCTBM|nr:centrosomal protein of 152 kDa isoform X2 [Octopus bimaculoides]|eukprot:XP_014768020.1 PREDICTED: centrosomal protein of 152 kDa-like [Octopus bimaculoides]
MNTTTSINFDAAALQSQDEAEYQKEEQQQQEELRQLLSNALDDITEDGLSVSSNDDDEDDEDDGGGEATEHRRQSRKKRSLNGSFEHRNSMLSSHTFPGARTKLPDACSQQHTETMTIPLGSSGQMPVDQHCRQRPEVSSQQTPSMYYPQFHYLYSIATDKDTPIMTATSNNYEQQQQQPTHPMFHQAHQHHFGLIPTSSVAHEAACNNNNNNNNNNTVDANHWLDPHEEIYYRENYGTDPVARQDFYQHHQHHPVVLPHDGTNFAPRHISPHQTNGEIHPQTPQHRAAVLENSSVNNKMGFDAIHSRQAAAQSNGYTLPTEAEKPAVSWDQLNGYKVQYRKPTDGGTNAFQTETALSRESSPHKQEDFVHIGGSGEQKELVQLQILYKARGRKVDELSQELSNLKKEMEEEVELLQQKVMEVAKEREGAVTSLKICQELLEQSKTEVSQMKGQLATSETLAQALTKSKEEVIGKLMSAESAIESLNHQVEELSKSETLERARLQHDSIIEGLQHRYQKEINILNKEIDSLTQDNKSREEEVSMLKRQLNDALKNVENAQINRAETINRLTRTLEESQRQCQHLLQASAQSNSSSQQLTDFQNRLQQAESAKRAAEEKFADFQQELKSLKFQLSMFDSASKLGVFASKEPDKANSNLENSFQELGIKKKLVFSTPETSLSEDSGNESQIRGLKHELERCLINNREKQAYIEELRESVQKLQKEISDWQLRCSKSEETIEALKVRKNSSFEESLLQKELEATRDEVAQCQKDNQNYKERLRLAKEVETQLKACNDDLESKLENIREKCDAEKVSALEQCKKTYETFQDDVKERLFLDLQTQYDEKHALVVSECEKKLSFLKSNLEAALTREDELKEIYVSVCQEKSQLEDQLAQQTTDLQENNANGTPRLSKPDCLEVASVEVQCLLDTECNSSSKDVLGSELEQEMKERLLVKIQEEIAAETQEKLEAVRQQVIDGFQKERDDELENYKKALQEKIEDEVRKEWMVAQKNNQIPVGIQVCLDESEDNNEEYIEKLRTELLAEIDKEKQNEWLQRETEIKKEHLEEIKQLQRELQQKSENPEIGFGFSISSQIMKERREEERQRIKSGVDAAKIEWQHLHESRLEMEVKRKIAAEKEVWQKDVVAECQKEWQGRLQKEKTKWENCAKEQQQKALVAAVEMAKNNWAKRQEVHRDEMQKKLEQEKMNLQKEHKEKLQILLNQLQSEYWTSVSSIQKNLVRYLSENSFRMQQLIYLSERNPMTTNLWDRLNFHNISDVNSRQITNISHRADHHQLQPQPFVPRPFNSGDGQVLNRIEENSESSYFEISEELR